MHWRQKCEGILVLKILEYAAHKLFSLNRNAENRWSMDLFMENLSSVSFYSLFVRTTRRAVRAQSSDIIAAGILQALDENNEHCSHGNKNLLTISHKV